MTACRRSASPRAHAKLAAGSTLMQSCTFQVLLERDQLPVKHFEEEILSTIDSNPVVLIRGATGCGKTTQVPQFILDRFIKGGRASDCNIVVTQVAPRPAKLTHTLGWRQLLQCQLLSAAQADQRRLRGRASGLRERRGPGQKLRLQRPL